MTDKKEAYAAPTDKRDLYKAPKDPELRSCSATEALRRDLISIDVAEEEEVVLSLTRREHHKYFAQVTLDRFEDLQVLGLVPRRMKQQAIKEAIKADDALALRIAEEQVRSNRGTAAPCDCHDGMLAAPSFGRDLRATFRNVRRDYNPELARLLTDHYEAEFAWDSPLAASVRGWTVKYTTGARVAIALFEDITIGRNGRLEVDAASTVLFAGAIRIHRTGSLIHRGAYLRIWANSIENFLDIPAPSTTATEKIWALEH